MDEVWLNKQQFKEHWMLNGCIGDLQDARREYVTKKQAEGWRLFTIPSSCRTHSIQKWFRDPQKAPELQVLFNYLWGSYHMESSVSYWTTANSPCISLADLPCAKVASCAVPAQAPKANKGKKAMRYDEYDRPVVDEAGGKRDYLYSRANNVYYTLQSDLEKTFGLRDDESPETPKALVERITSGKYMIMAGKEDAKVYDPQRYIRWRDPSVKEDKAGYTAAATLLDKEQTKVTDAIAVYDAKDALAAVQAFENWKPTGVAN